MGAKGDSVEGSPPSEQSVAAFGRRAQGGDPPVVAPVVGMQRALGLMLDRYVDADAGAGVALVGQYRQPARGVRVERGQDQLAGGGQVVGGAGTDGRDPQWEATGVADDLHAAAEGVVLPEYHR